VILWGENDVGSVGRGDSAVSPWRANLPLSTVTTRKNPAPAPAPAPAAVSAPEPAPAPAPAAVSFDAAVSAAVIAAGHAGDRAATIIKTLLTDDTLFLDWQKDCVDLDTAVMMAAIATEEFNVSTVASPVAFTWPATILKLAKVRGIELGGKLPVISGMPSNVLGASAPSDLEDLNGPVKTRIKRPRPASQLLFSLAWGNYGNLKLPSIAEGEKLPLAVLLTVLNSVPSTLFKEAKFLKKLQTLKGGTSVLSVIADRIGRYVCITDDFHIVATAELFASENGKG
jgi:hypothetical protein